MIFFYLSLYRFLKFCIFNLNFLKFKLTSAAVDGAFSKIVVNYRFLFFRFLGRLSRILQAFRGMSLRLFLSNFTSMELRFRNLLKPYRSL